MDTTVPYPNMEEYSAASTTIKFDQSVPLLRGPIPAGPHDDPSNGEFLLAFRSPQSWASAYKSCESKILSQCEHGARIGCAVTASNKCKPPWWRNLIGYKPVDFKQREDCEVREMEACLVVAKDKCVGFAKEKLLKPFRDARIAGRLGPKEVQKLVCLASLPESSKWRGLIGLDRLGEREFGLTNYPASELLGSDNNYEYFLK
ncbi:Bifunctional lysine-specific demethylase and histidyl-hydroxylase [Melia azedarach]|uniref:Bifunctional lysine-specific demethylase and histidyl-hydroxylase n=1 Tax=Melia azedarach TaxID=155640 RepID=A0ACC1YUL1_MELAZ|nr:Bifunctional lysine-specific demethylase and histidyl-hydroxylase [Melia azedarach]